jgi:glyoxylase-like metal-dependent hydrolase (beta-lactamase superfamily II)
LTEKTGWQSFEWHEMNIPTPFPIGPVNVYLIKADPITLIDTGPSTPDARKALIASMALLGVKPQDIKRVLITHGHSDHSGQAGWFQQMGAEVFIHPVEAEKLSGFDVVDIREQFLMQMGVPQKQLDMLRPLTKTAMGYFDRLMGYTPLQGGEEIPFAGFNLSVLATPGHSGGHMAFYQQETEVLFSGDTILKTISPNPLPELNRTSPGKRSKSLGAFLSTLESLEQVNVQHVLPGHGESIKGHSLRLHAMRDHHHRRLHKLHDLLANPSSPYELATRLYGELTEWDIMLGVFEVCAHLDLMKDQGLVDEKLGDDGILRYTRLNRNSASLG